MKEPEIVEEKKEVSAPVKVVEELPAADLVMNAEVAQLWLTDGNARLRGVYRSVRFEPAGIPAHHITFLLSLASEAIRGEYEYDWDNKKARGVLYVPVSFANTPVLADMVKGKPVAGYVPMQRK